MTFTLQVIKYSPYVSHHFATAMGLGYYSFFSHIEHRLHKKKHISNFIAIIKLTYFK